MCQLTLSLQYNGNTDQRVDYTSIGLGKIYHEKDHLLEGATYGRLRKVRLVLPGQAISDGG
jgi:hypothetical protein